MLDLIVIFELTSLYILLTGFNRACSVTECYVVECTLIFVEIVKILYNLGKFPGSLRVGNSRWELVALFSPPLQ